MDVVVVADRFEDARRERSVELQRELVRVDVGHLRQVVPDTLRHSWEMVVFGTPLDGVPLLVREIPAVVECRRCGSLTRLEDPIFRCAECGSNETDVISGNELFVTSLDLTVDSS